MAMVEFLKELFTGIFLSINSITTWIGIVSFIFFFFPKLGGRMKNQLEKIRPWPYGLLIFLGLILISIILTSYSMYESKQQQIKVLQKQIFDPNTINTKQEIRTLLESINPEILRRIYAGQKKILTTLSTPNEVKLSNLSERPDFEKYLSFKQINNEKDDFNDFEDPNIFIEGDKYFSWEQAYYHYPKDALIK